MLRRESTENRGQLCAGDQSNEAKARRRVAEVGHEQKIMIDRFLRVRDAALGPTCCDRRGLTHSEEHDLSIEPARLNAGVRRGVFRVEDR